MNLRLPGTLALLLSTLAFFSMVSVTLADPWSAIQNSGYAVTMVDPPHGTVVFPGTIVTLRAGTTHYVDEDVHSVTFRWMPPSGSGLSETLHQFIPLSPSSPEEYTDNGDLIYDAFDTLSINALGDWGVQVWFHDSQGNIMHRTDIIAIRAVSFNVVPEAPLGTIALMLGMFAALGLFAIKKRVTSSLPT